MTVTETFQFNNFLQNTKTLGGTTTFADNHVHLSFGYPYSALFPLKELAQAAFDETLAKPNALHYFGDDGTQLIRKWLVARLQQFSIQTKPANITITAGAAQAIEVLARTLVNPGDEIWVEDPSFFGAIRSFKLAGATVRPFPLQEDGIDVDALEKALITRTVNQQPLPKCLYIMPNYQNPTGITLSLEKRKRLAALASTYHFYILEDDAYAELNYNDETLPAIQSFNTEHVIHIGTFSKFIAPGIRLGWAIVPAHLQALIQQFLHGSQTNPYMQQIISKFLQTVNFDDYVGNLRTFYKQQRNFTAKLLHQTFGKAISLRAPDGGFFITFTFLDGTNTEKLAQVAEKLGVSVVDGTAFYLDGAHHNMLRLCFTYCSKDQIMLGITRLKEAYDTL
ncbi:MAG: PLP-dependent aminotransferase family protein [Solibacillus sp.]